MAHFAKIEKETNKVLDVIVISNDVVTSENDQEIEQLGLDFIATLYPDSSDYIWKQTSYNNNFRGKFAGIGGSYNEELDAFIPPKTEPSWTLNTKTLLWDPPIEKPETFPDGKIGDYQWDEDLYQSDNTKGWKFVEIDPNLLTQSEVVEEPQ